MTADASLPAVVEARLDKIQTQALERAYSNSELAALAQELIDLLHTSSTESHADTKD
jgi:hypothetical protein